MLYRLAPISFHCAAIGPNAKTIYTVPSPTGRQPGVGRDGRLHLLTLTTTNIPAGGALPAVIVEYFADDGSLVGRFVDTSWLGATTSSGDASLSWSSEPRSDGSTGSFEPGQAPGRIASTGRTDSFTWLLANYSVGLRIFTTQGETYTVNVLVEDFGQLAEGEDYRIDTPTAPVFLLPANDSGAS